MSVRVEVDQCKSTEERTAPETLARGIRTVRLILVVSAEIARYMSNSMKRRFGVLAPKLHRFCRAISGGNPGPSHRSGKRRIRSVMPSAEIAAPSESAI